MTTTTRCGRGRRGAVRGRVRTGLAGPAPGTCCGRRPSSSGSASGRCRCDGSTRPPGKSTSSTCPAGRPAPPSAPPAPPRPGSCGRSSAAKAGTSSKTPTSPPTPPPRLRRDLVKDRAHITDAVRGRRATGATTSPRRRARSPRRRSTTSSPRPASGAGSNPTAKARRVRSTRRRQDTPNLPRRPSGRRRRWVGRSPTTGPGRRSGRPCSSPSPCPSYGPVRRDDSMPVDPTPVRLRAGGAGRPALRQAARPVVPEPAPGRRLRRAVLRRRRTPETRRTARPLRDPRHPPARRRQAAHRRHLRPGLVAGHRRPRLHRHRPPAWDPTPERRSTAASSTPTPASPC